ncbi:MAG: TIR domain-containing protein [Cyanobacteria bacterium P01_A01_bin.137]
MSLTNRMAQYRLRLAYRRPTADRLRRIAVIKPRDNDIFVSYVAQDADFVRRLDKSIRDQGFDPWIDFDDIPDFNHKLDSDTHYQQEIKAGILGADVFVSVLSKAALATEQSIQQLKLAQRLNKLIILLCKELPDECDERIAFLDDLHYLDLSSPLVGRVFEQIALNIIHLQTYTRLLARATEWDRQGRPQQYLLTPEDLKAVKKQKRWIETHKLGNQFQFTSVQKVFLETVNKVHETSEYFGKSPPDIFVSYSRSNKNFVEKLSQSLKNERWKVWIDRDRIPVAANWRDEAEEGIRYAHTVVFVICSDSLLSKNCQWEFEKAKKYKKRIIPIISDSDYNRAIFGAMGLSSVQYVSFIRGNQSFEQSLQQLLEALKENLDDLKTYRRLLINSYEWSDRDRIDGFLMSRDEYKEIQQWSKQRQNLSKKDNRELEPLLSRQKEYIHATKRYLDSQRRRQSLYLSAILTTFFGLSGLLLVSTFSEIRALVKSLDNLKELDALVIAIQAGKRVKRSDLFLKSLRPNLRSKATTALHRTSLKLREINRLDEHEGEVLSIVFSPDGQKIVSLGADESIRFWGLNEDFVSHSKVESEPVLTASYNPDGKIVATGRKDGFIKLWKSDGELLKVLKRTHKGAVNQIVFSPGGQYLVSAGVDGKVFLWTQQDNFNRPVVINHGVKTIISAVTFSSRGQYFASADLNGGVKLWNLEGKLIQEFQHQGFVSQPVDGTLDIDAIFTMQFSPDGSLLAFAGASGIIQIQDLKRETVRTFADHDDSVYQIAFSTDGNTLASASADGTVKLWRPRESGSEILAHTLRGHQGPIYRVRFGPQDDVLATGGADGIVRLWLTDKGTLVDSFEGHNDLISSLAFSPKTTLGYKTVLASSSNDGDIRLWNIESPIQPLPHDNRVFDVAFRPDGRVVASSGVHTIRLWRKEEATLRSHIEFGQESNVYTLDYNHPSGDLLAAGGSEGQIKLWQPDLSTKQPTQVISDAHSIPEDLDSGKQGVLDLSFSPDGQWMASGGADRTLKLWQVNDDSLIQRYITLPQSNDVTGVAFSQDSQFLAVSIKADSDTNSRGISLWEIPGTNLEHLQPSLKFKTTEGHSGTVSTVAINPKDSNVLASGGVDGKVNLWNASGKLIKTLDVHSDPVTQVSFSEDGLFLASSSNDGTIILWTSQGDLISVLERHERAVSSVEFGPGSGEVLVSSSFDTDVLLWTLWDLSNVGMTVENQNQKILKMLVSKGCEAVEPFLETHQRRQTLLSGSQELNVSEQDSLRELQDIKDFCDTQ